MTRLLAMLALLNAGQSMAGDYTATNQMPEMIHNLMAAEGDGIDQTHFSLRPQNPNSLRNLKPVKYPQFIPLKLPTKNAGWTLWNNSSIKHVDRNADTINRSGPTSISAYELDINYSFHF
jgi:hypothetical protein